MRRAVLFSLLLAFLPLTLRPQAHVDRVQATLEMGIAQFTEGDFETAVFTLDSVVRSLADRPGALLARALLYLGAAYVGLDHEDAARGKFRDAAKLDRALRASPDQFPGRVVDLFEHERLKLTAAKSRRGRKLALIAAGVGGATALGISYDRPGAFLVRLMVRDVKGASTTATLDVTRVSFSASGSDPDGDPLSYSWSFGDGDVADGASVSHVYRREGAFEVTLSARDGLAATTAKGGVTARSLTGLWQPAPVVLGVQEYRLTQDGFRISAEIKPPPGASACGTSGEIMVPRTVRFSVGACFPDGTFPLKLSVEGVVDSSLQFISGEILCAGQLATDGCRGGASTLPITLTRAP